MLNKQTFLIILEMIFINLNSTKYFLTIKLIQLILLVYESYVSYIIKFVKNLTVGPTVTVFENEYLEDIQLNKTNSEHNCVV